MEQRETNRERSWMCMVKVVFLLERVREIFETSYEWVGSNKYTTTNEKSNEKK